MPTDQPATAALPHVRYGRVQWEVWGDGEELRRGAFDSWEQAAAHVARLSDEWRSIEIVMVTRTVIRVR